MKKTKKLLATTVLSTFLLTGLPSVAMAQNVTVTLPNFPVTLNGIELQPSIEDYPVIVYNNITYFPMTYHYANFLGLSTEWADNTLTVTKVTSYVDNPNCFEKKEGNKNKYTAAVSTANIVVNGKAIDNRKEEYPLLVFRDITYFPLTWRFAVEEFGWNYTFDAKNGLEIKSKPDIEIYGKSERYVIDGDVAVGYPSNTYDDKYTFTYKIGDAAEKEFSLKSQLMDGDYYFNSLADENGYAPFDTYAKPSIEGNILTLPSVRQDLQGNKENLIIKIDFIQGTIISKTPVERVPVSK